MDETTRPKTLPTRVITPHTGVEGILYALRSLYTGFSQATYLARRFFVRDTSAAYRQSVLGYIWLLLPPIANTLVWVFLNGSGVVQIASGDVPYPIFVLSGTVLWTAFNGSLMAMLGVVQDANSVLAKVNFPHESLPYAALLKASVDALIPALLLVPAIFMFGIDWHVQMLLFPVALLGCLLAGSTFGLIVIPVAALYTDVSRAIQFGLRFGFFVTPVVFALPASGVARWVMLANPVTPLVLSGRGWLTGSAEAMPGMFWAVTVGCLVVGFISLVLFKVAMPFLIERVST